MSGAAAAAIVHADRPMRRVLGPLFGTACLLATCTGVAVLALLLGSVVAAALQGHPEHPWYAVGANLSDLAGLVRRWRDRAVERPGQAGYRVGITGSLVAAGAGGGDGDTGGRRGGCIS